MCCVPLAILSDIGDNEYMFTEITPTTWANADWSITIELENGVWNIYEHGQRKMHRDLLADAIIAATQFAHGTPAI